MAIKKLSDGPIEMTISSARLVEGLYGEQVQFVGVEHGEDEETLLYISERSAVRQLERLSLSVEGCAGETLRFEQVAKDGKTYNNIYRATGGDTPLFTSNPSGGSMTVSAPKASRDSAEPALVALYADCLKSAAETVESVLGPKADAQSIVAAAATIFIQANRR